MPPSPEFNRSAGAVTSIPLSLMAHADQDMKTSPKIQYTVNHNPQNWQPVNQFHSSLLQQCLWYQTPSVYLGWVQQLVLLVRQSKDIAQSISLFQHSSHKYLPSRLYCSFTGNQSPRQSETKHCWWLPPCSVRSSCDIVSSPLASRGIFTVIFIFPVWVTFNVFILHQIWYRETVSINTSMLLSPGACCSSLFP